MMVAVNPVQSLIRQTADARTSLIAAVRHLSPEQAAFKPAPDIWSVNENLEHLVLAEVSGVTKIWAAAEGLRHGKPAWTGEHTNRGLGIDEIIARTWKPREAAPPVATPHIGGPLPYWIESLALAQPLLNQLEAVLAGLDPQAVLFPHFLSGPLDALQRIDFVRFHLARHHRQIDALLAAPGFPAA